MAVKAFDQILVKGAPRYRVDKQFVAKAKVPEVVLEALTLNNIVDENGLVIVEDKTGSVFTEVPENVPPEDDAVTTDTTESAATDTVAPPAAQTPPAPEAPATLAPEQAAPAKPAPKFKSQTPQSDPGMGFKRVNGKTVDIFDEVTPHTAVRLVGGQMAPLSAENYLVKSDAEIEIKLKELGFAVIDYNKAENDAANAASMADDGDDDGLSED